MPVVIPAERVSLMQWSMESLYWKHILSHFLNKGFTMLMAKFRMKCMSTDRFCRARCIAQELHVMIAMNRTA